MRYLYTLGLFFFLIPTLVHAQCPSTVVNINTASKTTLESLEHIGEATAQKIIDYRASNPFQTIEDIKKASDYITDARYEDIASCITVGDTATSTADTAATSSTPSVAAPPSGGGTTYVPPPTTLSITISGAQTAVLEVPFRLSARVTTKSGTADQSARIVWSFGDGSASEGIVAEKTYRYAGTYLVTAMASDGSASARGELVVTAAPAQVRLLPVSGDGITVANDAHERLDLSGWRLLSGIGSFRIPDGTTILPEAATLFPYAITNLPRAADAALVYPDGIIAARTAPAAPVAGVVEASAQPSAPADSSYEVQTVRNDATPPVALTSVSGTAHEEAVLAPTATVETAAVGAVSAARAEAAPSASAPPSGGLLHSPWILGLLGVIATAGGGFILL